MPDNDAGVVGSILILLVRTTFCFHRRIGLGRSWPIHVDISLGEIVDPERPVIPRLPVRMAFYLSPFNLRSQRNDQSDILLPDDAPEILNAY